MYLFIQTLYTKCVKAGRGRLFVEKRLDMKRHEERTKDASIGNTQIDFGLSTIPYFLNLSERHLDPYCFTMTIVPHY